MTDELKPCPHCGAAAELRSWDWPYDRYQVRCSKRCNGGRKAVEAEAIAAWNTRQPDPAVLVEALKRIDALRGGFCFDSDADVFRLLDKIEEVSAAALAQWKDKSHG
jgi:hypothetical protein